MTKHFTRKLLSLLAILLVASLVLVACAPEAAPTEAPAAPEEVEEEAPPPEPAEEEEEMEPVEEEEAAPAEDRTLTIAVSGDIAGWDPVSSIYWLANEVIINTHDTLIDYAPTTDEEGRPVRDITEFVPRLAESWEVSEDGTSFTFKLREDVKFNNGDSMNAEAVKKSFERILANPSLASFLLADVAFVRDPSQMVVEDEYTITFNLDQPNPIFLKVLQEMNMVVTNVAQIEAEGGSTQEEQNEWTSNNPTGTGPYVLEKFEPGVELVLKANENYWGEAPYYEQIVYTIVPSAENRLLLLKNGDVDVVYEIPLKDFADLTEDPNVTPYVTPTFGNLYFLNGRNSDPWGDPLLRQAIAYAIPYDDIIENVTYGYATKAPSWVPVGLEGFYPASTYTYDLDKAAELLVEAGYPEGEGLPPITFALKQGVPEEEQAIVYIQSELAKIGIDMQIEPLSLAAHSEQLAKHELPFSFNFWIPYVPDPVYHLYWNFRSADSGCCNYLSYSNEAMDALIDQGLVELDPEVRSGLVEDAQALLVPDFPQIALYHPTWNLAMLAGIEGYYYWPDTLLRFEYLTE
jgi:peptide/nickel transport system substrate-binding protein